MLKFIDNEGQEHLVQAEFKYTNGVNGEKSISGEILTNDIVIHAIGRGWKLEFEDEFYCITYALPVDNGKDISVEFDAVQEFFFDFDKSVIHSTLNGSHTFEGYLSFIFDGSGYQYRNEVSVNAFEKENFGLKNRLTLFKDIVQSAGVEFVVSGKVVRILDKVGTDLSTIVRKGFNLEELKLEHNIGDFITCKKGYGAFFDEEDHSKGRLEVEYISPLADVYGILEGDPVVDERFKVEGNLLSRITKEVENSYSISVQMEMADLSEAGYKVERPRAGDYIMAINDDIGFEEKVRIVSFETYYDTNSNVIDHTVTCNSLGMASIQSSNDATWKGNVEAELSGVKNQINYVLVSADGKNSIFYGLYGPDGKGEPKANKKGDLWYKPVGEETVVYIWDGQVWQEFMSTVDNKIIQETIDQLEAESEQIKQDVDKSLADAEQAIKKAEEANREAEQARDDAFNSDKLAKEAKELAELANQGVISVDEKSNQALADAERAREEAFDSKAIADEAKLESSKALQKGNHNEVEISRLEGQLQVTNSKVEGNTTNLLNLKLESDKLSSSVSKTQYDLENLAIGSTNYIEKSSGMDKASYDSFRYYDLQSQLIVGEGVKLKKKEATGRGFMTKDFYVSETDLPENASLTLSLEVLALTNLSKISTCFIRWFLKDGTFKELPLIDLSLLSKSNAFERVFATGEVPKNVDYTKKAQLTLALAEANDECIVRKFQLEKSTKVSDWKPNFSDYISQNEFSIFEQTYQGFQSNVQSDILNVKSQQTQMANQISSAVEKIENLEIKSRNWQLNTANPLKVKGNNSQNQGSYPYRFSFGELKKIPGNIGDKFIVEYDYELISDNPQGTLKTQFNNIPYGISGPTINFSKNHTAGHFKHAGVINESWLTSLATTLGIRVDNLDGELVITNWRFILSDKSADWSPAPEDLANKSEVIQLSDQITQTITKTNVIEGQLSQQQSQVNQLSDKLTVNISDTSANATKISQLELTTSSMSLTLASVERENDRLNTKVVSLEANLNGFQATVTNELTGFKSQQTQMANQISSVVKKVDNLGSDNILSLSNLDNGFLSNGILVRLDESRKTTVTKNKIDVSSSNKLIIQLWVPDNSNPMRQIYTEDCQVTFFDSNNGYFTPIKYRFKKQAYNVLILDVPENAATVLFEIPLGKYWLENRQEPTRVKVENNDVATDYSEAIVSMSEITQLSDQITLAVKEVEDLTVENKAQIVLLSGQITSTVEKTNTIDGKVSTQQTQITQLSSSITLKADKNKLISQINVSPESIRLESKLIHLSGQSLIDNAVITSAMIKDLNASKITTGTLNAANVNIINMNANNITSGKVKTSLLESDFVRVGFNQSVQGMELTNNELAFFKNGVKTGSVGSEGQYYYYGNSFIGLTGESRLDSDATIRGIGTLLNGAGDYVSWAFREGTSGSYTNMLLLDPKDRVGRNGIGTVTSFLTFRPARGILASGSKQSGQSIDDVSLKFETYNYGGTYSPSIRLGSTSNYRLVFTKTGIVAITSKGHNVL